VLFWLHPHDLEQVLGEHLRKAYYNGYIQRTRF